MHAATYLESHGHHEIRSVLTTLMTQSLLTSLSSVVQVQRCSVHDCRHHPCLCRAYCHDCGWQSPTRSGCKLLSCSCFVFLDADTESLLVTSLPRNVTMSFTCVQELKTQHMYSLKSLTEYDLPRNQHCSLPCMCVVDIMALCC